MLGKLYVARHFPAQAKARMEQLVAKLWKDILGVEVKLPLTLRRLAGGSSVSVRVTWPLRLSMTSSRTEPTSQSVRRSMMNSVFEPGSRPTAWSAVSGLMRDLPSMLT